MKKYAGNIFITNIDATAFSNQLHKAMNEAVERHNGKDVSFDVHYHPVNSPIGGLIYTALVEIYEEDE